MINRLFSDIYGNVGSNVQNTSTSMATVIKRYCNDVYFDILQRVNYQNIDDDYTFPTVAGTSDYVLPQNFGKEVYVFDLTNRIEIAHISLQELVQNLPDAVNQTGQVQRYTILDKAVRSQPSSSSTLSIVSSSAADTTQTVYIVGSDSNGVELSESVTLTGTTPAVSANSYVEVRSLSKSATTTGRITITSNSGAVTVAIMSPIEKAYKVKAIRLNYTPNGIISIAMPYVVYPTPLVNDNDQPVIDCANIIELGATMMSWRYLRQMAKANEYERQYEKALDTLVWNMENSLNQQHRFGITPYPRNDY